MKRVVFAWITFAYTFDTKEELEKYRLKNKNKYWHWNKEVQDRDGTWYVEIQKPYDRKRYECGW